MRRGCRALSRLGRRASGLWMRVGFVELRWEEKGMGRGKGGRGKGGMIGERGRREGEEEKRRGKDGHGGKR